MSTQITPEQIKQSDEARAKLRKAVEQARTDDEKKVLQEQLDTLEAQHRSLHQAYTAECQQIYMQGVLAHFK